MSQKLSGRNGQEMRPTRIKAELGTEWAAD